MKPHHANPQRLKKLTGLLALLALLAAVSSCHGDETRGQAAEDTAGPIDSIPYLVMQVRQCARLYTAEYKIRKIVTHDDVVQLKGTLLRKDFNIKLPMGDRKIAIPMSAKLKAYIDFGDFSEQDVERDGRRVTIVLPDPQVVMTSSRISQKEVRQYVGLTRSQFTDKELSSYEQQGRQAILRSVPSLGIYETARENATRILVPMLAELGYREEDVTVVFRKDRRQNGTLINSNIERP